MFIIQSSLRLLGVALVLVLIVINTNKGKEFLIERGVPLQNSSIREFTGLDLDVELSPAEQLNDQRPLYGVFDLPSAFFIICLLLAYIFLSFDVHEYKFIFLHLISSSSLARKTLENLIDKMKILSETYYTSGGEALRGAAGKESIPPVWNVIIEQIEMRIPFEDILQILGNKAALTRKNYDRNIKIMANLSNLAPSFGVMGTVLGLMNVLVGLDDPSSLGPGAALALLTTFYGLFLSVILFKPFLTHLENMKVIEMNGYQAASFWLKNLANNKPSFYLDQTIQNSK